MFISYARLWKRFNFRSFGIQWYYLQECAISYNLDDLISNTGTGGGTWVGNYINIMHNNILIGLYIYKIYIYICYNSLWVRIN
jgi:hypothetical protein